jgi:hypothetical protein
VEAGLVVTLDEVTPADTAFTGVIKLKGIALTASSGFLVNAAAEGAVIFTAGGQVLKGDLNADNISAHFRGRN